LQSGELVEHPQQGDNDAITFDAKSGGFVEHDFKVLAELYKDAPQQCHPILGKALAHWQHGGYFTCLDRQGKVYDLDKFIWFANRLSVDLLMLYNQLETKTGSKLLQWVLSSRPPW